jgi:uncharacterized protein
MDGAQLPQEQLKSALLQHDPAFRDLVHEHQVLDEEIRRLSSLAYLTEDQRLEEVALKKRKLALKDRVAERLRQQAAVTGTA